MRNFILAAVLVLMASGAQAATLNIDGVTGQLLGASGVDVGGTLYNVEFLDGTCTALFNGCDDASDFTFQSQADATLASLALLDQVFLDGVLGNFDSFPPLTSGCTTTHSCFTITPYGATAAIYPNFNFYGPRNTSLSSGLLDVAYGDSSISRFTDITTNAGLVYALWSAPPAAPSPVPSGAGGGLVVVLGAVGWLASYRRGR